ncbi:MAG: YeeE/YedE thiosulfate transporter family protein, partial [Rhodoplanes sp.]
PSAGVRYAVAFVAGFLMLFGARLADGCTSGHGLSGVAQLAVGSTVAVAAMFAGGIGAGFLLLRRI